MITEISLIFFAVTVLFLNVVLFYSVLYDLHNLRDLELQFGCHLHYYSWIGLSNNSSRYCD